MDIPPFRVLSLCAGSGAADLATGLAAPGSRTVCYVEREAFACEHLAAAMEAGRLDPAPVWTDLASFDGIPWRGAVDLVLSGLPCQPYSCAGKRNADADERALWPEFVRVVRETAPAVVFLENVPGFLKHCEPAWRELRGLGFEWAPPLLHTASEAGAPHRRTRLFLLATNPSIEGLERHARHDRTKEGRRIQAGPPPEGSPCAAHPDRRRRAGEWCGWVFDRERQTFRHDPDGRCDGCRIDGSPWAVESPVCRVDDGAADWVVGGRDRLRLAGNGVVPLVAANAFRILWGELSG